MWLLSISRGKPCYNINTTYKSSTALLRPILILHITQLLFKKLCLNFGALFGAENKFAFANLYHWGEKVRVLFRWCKYYHWKTYREPQILHQNQAVILQQLCSGNIFYSIGPYFYMEPDNHSVAKGWGQHQGSTVSPLMYIHISNSPFEVFEQFKNEFYVFRSITYFSANKTIWNFKELDETKGWCPKQILEERSYATLK